MIMQRRGLNFVSDAIAENMEEESVMTIEAEVDNVAPKIVGILALSEACDIKLVRQEMVKYCQQYQEDLLSSKKRKKEAGEMEDEEDVKGDADDSQFKAYVCPNPGSSTNLGSKKQRLIFMEIDRND